jgi:hypothetical protein
LFRPANQQNYLTHDAATHMLAGIESVARQIPTDHFLVRYGATKCLLPGPMRPFPVSRPPRFFGS